MHKINGILPSVRSGNVSGVTQNIKKMPPADTREIKTDSFTRLNDWPEDTDWQKMIDKELGKLQKEYPKIHIVMAEELGTGALPQIASGLGYGTHLVISKEWLEQMKSGPESFERGKAILKNVLSKLSEVSGEKPACGALIEKDGVKFWSAKSATEKQEGPENDYEKYKRMLEQFKESNKRAAENKNMKIKVKTANYSVAGLYAQVAGAGSKSQVQAAMGTARRSMASLRMAISYGSDKERSQAKAALGSIQKLLLRGNRKIRRLNEQELVALRRKRAIKQEQAQKEMQLRIELQKMRSKQKTANRAIAMEGHLEDVNNAARFRREHEREYEAYASYIPEIATVTPVEIAGASEGAIPVADIAVSPTISFDQILA